MILLVVVTVFIIAFKIPGAYQICKELWDKSDFPPVDEYYLLIQFRRRATGESYGSGFVYEVSRDATKEEGFCANERPD
jgi:hypothetical protein